MPDPAEVRSTFAQLEQADPERAVRYLYDLGLSSGYIRAQDIARNICWTAPSSYGDLELTINLSKPEKDPRAIAAAAQAEKPGEPSPQSSPSAAGRGLPPRDAPPTSVYPAASEADPAALVAHPAASASPAPLGSTGVPAPRCDLCRENECYPGDPAHPAKPGLRIARIELGGEPWGLQFSPYAYFDEHCIALSYEHRPMRIDRTCFERLLDFVDRFPFYFAGSNADLPIVGGSILTHDHYQGGRHEFPLMRAHVERPFAIAGCPDVTAGVVAWPASVIRLESHNRAQLVQAAVRILDAWRDHNDDACDIAAHSGPDPHNTLNPIARRRGDAYVLDLVLRNNRITPQRPWGLFHPAEYLHHIKRENIGLIEIMGLAILPPRLARELPRVQAILHESAVRGTVPLDVQARLLLDPLAAPHAFWAADLYERRRLALLTEAAALQAHPAEPAPPLGPVLELEVARVFEQVLAATGVFKRTDQGFEGWSRFLARL